MSTYETATSTLDLTVIAPHVVVAAGFPLVMEIIPADDERAVLSSADDGDDYWSTASIVKRLRKHFDEVLANAAGR